MTVTACSHYLTDEAAEKRLAAIATRIAAELRQECDEGRTARAYDRALRLPPDLRRRVVSEFSRGRLTLASGREL